MIENRWKIELEQSDYQGYYVNGKNKNTRNYLLMIANGYLGIRGCFNELSDRKEDSSIHCIGIYDQNGFDDPKLDLWKEIVNFPDFMSAKTLVDGERIFLKTDRSNVLEFRIYLDMKSATLHLDYMYKPRKGNRLKVSIERFCSYHNKNLIYNRATFECLDNEMLVEYCPGITGDVYDAHGCHLMDFFTDEIPEGILLTAKTCQHKYQIAIGSRYLLPAEVENEIDRNATGIFKEV